VVEVLVQVVFEILHPGEHLAVAEGFNLRDEFNMIPGGIVHKRLDLFRGPGFKVQEVGILFMVKTGGLVIRQVAENGRSEETARSGQSVMAASGTEPSG